MKKITLLMIMGLLTWTGQSQSKNFIDKAYLETTATVDTLVVPDRIYLSILISEKDTKGRTSVEELENKMEQKLMALGIDTQKQLTLSDLATNFKNYFLRRNEVLKNKAYTLVVYDAITAGKVIVGLESIDISNVHLNKTEYSKIEQLKLELRKKAITKAKIQSEAMLEPLDQQLGKAIFISDHNTSRFLSGTANAVTIRGYGNLKEKNYEPIAIEFEKIKVESTVNINFEIE